MNKQDQQEKTLAEWMGFKDDGIFRLDHDQIWKSLLDAKFLTYFLNKRHVVFQDTIREIKGEYPIKKDGRIVGFVDIHCVTGHNYPIIVEIETGERKTAGEMARKMQFYLSQFSIVRGVIIGEAEHDPAVFETLDIRYITFKQWREDYENFLKEKAEV
ncbi:MAG: hypothetical protein ACYCQJ_12825 [Nitrososphaerales archaeon]